MDCSLDSRIFRSRDNVVCLAFRRAMSPSRWAARVPEVAPLRCCSVRRLRRMVESVPVVR